MSNINQPCKCSALCFFFLFSLRCCDDLIHAAEPCWGAADAWALRLQAPRPAPLAPPGPSPPPQVLSLSP